VYGAHTPCILYLISQLFRPALKQIAAPNHKVRPYACKPCRKFSATPLLESGVRKNGKKPTRCQKRHKASVTSVIQAVAYNLSSASGLMSFRRKETQIGRRVWLEHLPARTDAASTDKRLPGVETLLPVRFRCGWQTLIRSS